MAKYIGVVVLRSLKTKHLDHLPAFMRKPCIPTGEGLLYLTTVLDLADRKVIGWALSNTLKATDTSVSAWRMALKNRGINGNLLFHSDRGVQYACTEFWDQLKGLHIVQSMTGPPFRFVTWKKAGRFEHIDAVLNQLDRQHAGRDPFPSMLCIDSQSVKLSPMICEFRGIDGHKLINAGPPFRFSLW